MDDGSLTFLIDVSSLTFSQKKRVKDEDNLVPVYKEILIVVKLSFSSKFLLVSLFLFHFLL